MFNEKLKQIQLNLEKVQGDIDWLILESTNVDDKDVYVSANQKILSIAINHIGTKEISGPGNNPQVMEYHKFASKNNDIAQNDSVPWCSSFLCYVVEKSGIKSTDSMTARSWLKWGLSVLDSPLPGDIVVYWRGSRTSWQGHCGVYLRTNADGSIVTLGGNQSDEVNVTTYSKDKLLDIRRAQDKVLDNKDAMNLKDLAHAVINGKLIGTGGKVS